MIKICNIFFGIFLLAFMTLSDRSKAADLPVVRASYNAIGGVFTPIWLAQTNAEDLEETYRTFAKVWERVPYVSTQAVQSVLHFTRHPAAKTAKPEQFIDNSILAELEKSGFVNQLYGR